MCRVEYNYFEGWTTAELQSIDDIYRPSEPITNIKDHISKAELQRNKKLYWMGKSKTPLACQLRRRVRNGDLKSVTSVKDEAVKVWAEESDTYNKDKATKQTTAENPRGVKRKRLPTETVHEYRKRRAAEKKDEEGDKKPVVDRVQSLEDQLYTKFNTTRPLGELERNSELLNKLFPNYSIPRTKRIQQLHLVLLELCKQDLL